MNDGLWMMDGLMTVLTVSCFIYFGYNTVYIPDNEKLLFSLDQTVTKFSNTLSLKISSRIKVNCGHCGNKMEKRHLSNKLIIYFNCSLFYAGGEHVELMVSSWRHSHSHG